MQIRTAIEALIFSADEPISSEMIMQVLNRRQGNEKLTMEAIEECILKLQILYNDPSFAMYIRKLAGGYLFATKPQYFELISEVLKIKHPKKLSSAALETLAIIAYRQPVTKGVIEQIRGVNVDYTIQKLLERELIEIKGRSEEPGRPLIYITSQKFMEYFGFAGVNDLPKIQNATGEKKEIGQESIG